MIQLSTVTVCWWLRAIPSIVAPESGHSTIPSAGMMCPAPRWKGGRARMPAAFGSIALPLTAFPYLPELLGIRAPRGYFSSRWKNCSQGNGDIMTIQGDIKIDIDRFWKDGFLVIRQ